MLIFTPRILAKQINFSGKGIGTLNLCGSVQQRDMHLSLGYKGPERAGHGDGSYIKDIVCLEISRVWN